MSQIKSFAFLPRRPDISPAQFRQHWSTIHRDHAVRIKTLRRYVQLHRTQDALPGFAPSIYDGVPEVWLDDLGDALGLASDPDYLDHAAKDEPNFIDMERMGGLVANEDVQLPGPPVRRDTPLVKGLLLVKRSTDGGGRAFRAWWHGLGAVVRGAVPNLTRYVQCSPDLDAYRDDRPQYDGVAELWWTDTAGFERAAGGLERLARTLADAPVDLDGTVSLVGEELRVIWPDDESALPVV
jgi:EthD domain